MRSSGTTAAPPGLRLREGPSLARKPSAHRLPAAARERAALPRATPSAPAVQLDGASLLEQAAALLAEQPPSVAAAARPAAASTGSRDGALASLQELLAKLGAAGARFSATPVDADGDDADGEAAGDGDSTRDRKSVV